MGVAAVRDFYGQILFDQLILQSCIHALRSQLVDNEQRTVL